jgi:hypothetical protein
MQADTLNQREIELMRTGGFGQTDFGNSQDLGSMSTEKRQAILVLIDSFKRISPHELIQ